MPDDADTTTPPDLAGTLPTLPTQLSTETKTELAGRVQALRDQIPRAKEFFQLQLLWPLERELVERAERSWCEVNGLLRCINNLSVEPDHRKTPADSSEQNGAIDP